MNDTPLRHRLFGALALLLPWSDALAFRVPFFSMGLVSADVQQLLELPALPVLLVDRLMPLGLGSLLLLVALFWAVVRNPGVPYFVRFNVLQAILVDIVLAVLGFAFSIFGCRPGFGGGFACQAFTNTVFLGSLLLVGFSLVQCLRGKEPEIPSISDAVRMQLF